MSTVFAERFNFGFVLFSLVILSSLSADTNRTTTDGVSDLSKEIKPTEELPLDKINSISTISQKDNSIDGYLDITTRAQTDLEVTTTQAETETDNISTTETNRNSEISYDTSIEPKSITTLGTNHQYSSLPVSETTAAHVEDQTTTANTDVEDSWSAKVNTTSETVQNNSIHHQENINHQFNGNSLEDVSNNSTENKTAISDPTKLKPTKETIMGVGIKTTVSVSLRVQDTKITGTNLTDAENSIKNSSCKVANNRRDVVNATCLESIESANITENTNETVYANEILQKSSAEPPALNSTPETEHNSTEISLNSTSVNGSEMESHSNQPNNTDNYSNSRTELNSNLIHNSTDSNTISHNDTENDSNSTQLKTTEIYFPQNATGTTVSEESSNSTNASTKVVDNGTTEAHFEVSTLQTIIANNETSEYTTTRTKTNSPISSTIWSTTDVETENATEAELTTTPQPTIRFEGAMKIVRGLNWSDALLTRQSPQYKKAERRIKSLLQDVFSSTVLVGILKDVEIDNFRQGSVLVDYVLTLVESDTLDPDYLVHAFNSYFKNNHTYRDIAIDPTDTTFEVVKVKIIKPTTESRVEPPVPQWVVAVVVISAASLVFIILFAAVTIYGRHYGRRTYNKKLQGDEIIFDKPDYQSGPRLSDAAYENLAADAVYDVESSPERSEGMTNSVDNQFDSWRTNRLTRMPSTKRFSFNSS